MKQFQFRPCVMSAEHCSARWLLRQEHPCLAAAQPRVLRGAQFCGDGWCAAFPVPNCCIPKLLLLLLLWMAQHRMAIPGCLCLQVVGLYRLCGSAAVKKELREAFERDSKAVTLCESQYPDINVITGNTFTCFSSKRVVPYSSCTFKRVELCFELFLLSF